MYEVDVIIPTLNRLQLLKRAISSVAAQTYPHWKIIVVDDGSTEPVAEYIEKLGSPRVRCIRHDRNLGACAARNTGMDAATGDWIAFLDSDDTWEPRKLEAQVSVVKSGPPDLVGVYCAIEFVTSTRRFVRRPSARGHIFRDLMENGIQAITGTSSYMVKRNLGDVKVRFDEQLPCYQDLDFMIRLSQYGQIDFVDEVLVKADQGHGGPSITSEFGSDYLTRIAALERAITNGISANPLDEKASRLGYLYLVQRALEVGDFRRARGYLSRARQVARFSPDVLMLTFASLLGRRALAVGVRFRKRFLQTPTR